jgi:KaiC/GvpD/RAD55 family RecA-like ATPase
MSEDDEHRHIPNEPTEPPPEDVHPASAGGRNVRRLASVRRVPPHDVDAEQGLLSCVLTRSVDAWPAAGAVESSAFYVVSHQHIHAAMAAASAAGEAIDVVTVADQLRRLGLLDDLSVPNSPTSGMASLMHLLALTWPSTMQASTYAATIERLARARRLLPALGAAEDAAWAGDLEAAMPAVERATNELASVAGAARSWEPVDMAELLAGGLTPVVPLLLARADGECLLYPGRVHAFNAEPESGKSWLAKAVCAEQLRFGASVLYLDFETDPEGVAERMLALGIDAADLGQRFVYVRPDDPLDLAARGRLQSLLAEHEPTVAIIDGVAEVLALNAWEENDAADYAAFLNALPRMLERAGVTVVLIDHVSKNPRERGRGGRGSGHKLAGITASFALEVAQPFGRGRIGRAKVRVEKDRIGWLRRVAGVGQRPVIAELELAANDDGSSVAIALHPPTAVATDPSAATFDKFRPTGYMERISILVEKLPSPVGVREIRRLVPGSNEHKDTAIARLVEEGFFVLEPGPRNAILHRSVRPFREHPSVDNEPEEYVESELPDSWEEPF